VKRTAVILFILGISLSVFGLFARSDETVTLTEDNHIVFSGQVTDASVAQAQIKLGQLSKKIGRNEVIYLVIDSPGGSVSAGNLFIDFAKSLPQTIKPICIFCASMGYHMFQSFDERLVYSSSTLMSHRASLGGIGGQVPGELETRLASIKDTLNQMDASVAKRVGLSTEAYQKLIYDELWLNGNSAVRTKHADRLAKIKCSEDLISGKREETVNTMFGAVDVTYSTCPLINGILDAKLAKTAKFRSRSEALNLVKMKKRSVLWNF
jgi:ATP-dependent protease ClpP protease subunit